LTHVNLNDQTSRACALEGRPVFSVQYHPEASPGRTTRQYLFGRFLSLMKPDGAGGPPPRASPRARPRASMPSYSASPRGLRHEIARARSEYAERTGRVFEEDEIFEARTLSFLEWYALERPLEGAGMPPVAGLAPATVDDHLRAAWLAWATSHRSLYDVARLRDGDVRLHDLVGGARFAVDERRRCTGSRWATSSSAAGRLAPQGALRPHLLLSPGRGKEGHRRPRAPVLAGGGTRADAVDAVAALRVRSLRYKHVEPPVCTRASRSDPCAPAPSALAGRPVVAPLRRAEPRGTRGGRSRSAARRTVVALLLLLVAGHAEAQTSTVPHEPSFSVDRLTPAPGPGGFFQVEDATLLRERLVGGDRGLVIDLAAAGDPAAGRRGRDADRAGGAAARLDLGFAYGWRDRVQIGLALPVIAFQDGDRLQGLGLMEPAPTPSLAVAGIGDLRLHGKLALRAPRRGYGAGWPWRRCSPCPPATTATSPARPASPSSSAASPRTGRRAGGRRPTSAGGCAATRSSSSTRA
jgi:hypothetical protein